MSISSLPQPALLAGLLVAYVAMLIGGAAAYVAMLYDARHLPAIYGHADTS